LLAEPESTFAVTLSGKAKENVLAVCSLKSLLFVDRETRQVILMTYKAGAIPENWEFAGSVSHHFAVDSPPNLSTLTWTFSAARHPWRIVSARGL